MMNTILNLGLNDDSVVGLANATGNERFAYDTYRRLINMFGDVVVGVDHEHFEEAFDKIKLKYQARSTIPMCRSKGMIELCKAYKEVYEQHHGEPFPQDPLEQLELAIEAVFKSWMQARAVKYRAGRRTSAACSARPSMCSRWCSATWATTRAPASRSRAIRRPARTSSTASF